MSQLAILSDEVPSRPVNVASVAMRSPFRYPGGKTWLVPTVRRWLRSHRFEASHLVEPFAGGGIVGLSALFDNDVERVTLVELDDDIAAVWRTIIDGPAHLLAEAIETFELTPESVREAIERAGESDFHRAFATLVRNRVSRGGILAPGAGFVKNGENGRGLASRWYPTTLKNRILAIARHRSRLSFVHGDGMEVLREHRGDGERAFFIDPPYVVAGRRLYTHCDIDHACLFETAASLRGSFLMTYDDAPEIRDLAARHGLEVATVPMKNTHHECKTELLISRSLADRV